MERIVKVTGRRGNDPHFAFYYPLGCSYLWLQMPALALLWLAVSSSPVAADATLRGVAAEGRLTIATRARTASAIHSLMWNGREFIDDYDHGRQLQSASNHGVVRFDFCPEGYNPTQAGSVNDGAGPTSTSIVLSEQVIGNQLISSGKMAFWQARAN